MDEKKQEDLETLGPKSFCPNLSALSQADEMRKIFDAEEEKLKKGRLYFISSTYRLLFSL